ncbi:MAG: hypothetical protein LBL69_00490 [Zoogloeaceae bacterium]|nr:hypothetical protein [Zoogloeaceae bacterium]
METIFTRSLAVLAVFGGLWLAALPVEAKPASYYLWMSEADGSRICTQIAPGDGWKLMGGPYKDGRCTKPAY